MPLIAPGEFTQQIIVRITVGMNPPSGDNDPHVGITDGVNHNQFYLVAHGTSGSSSQQNPCRIIGGTDSSSWQSSSRRVCPAL